MANMLIATPEFSDAATLSTTSSFASGLPLTNVQTYRRSKVARCTTPGSVVVVGDMGSLMPLNFAAALLANASATATVRWRFAPTEAELTSDPTVDTGANPANMPSGDVESVADFSARWFRLDIDDSDNPEGFLDIERIYVAHAWVIGADGGPNIAEGWGLGVEDDSVVVPAIDGGMLVTPRNQRRVITADLLYQEHDELLERAFAILRDRGIGRDLIVCRDPDLTDFLDAETVYGLLTRLDPIQNIAGGTGLYGWSLQVRELV